MPVPYAAIAAAAIPTIAGLFGKKNKVDEPPEIKQARNLLLNFAQSGQYGDFKAGAEVPLGYGDYNPTGIEQTGLSSLQSLLTSGIPEQYKLGDEALKSILASDQSSINSQFEPFKKQTMQDIADAETGTKRAAAYAGNLYSTKTIENLGKVRSRGLDTLTSRLAELTDQALNRRLQAVPLAYQSGQQQENLALNRIGASQTYGDLTRSLNDQAIKARDAELLRRRQELQLPIQAAGQVLGGPSQIPVSQSPYQQVLETVGKIGGNYLGNELFLQQYKSFFPPAGTSPSVPTANSAYGNRSYWNA